VSPPGKKGQNRTVPKWSLFVVEDAIKQKEQCAESKQQNIYYNAEDKCMQNPETRSVEEAVYEVASCFAKDEVEKEI